ncbi:PREDICTED: uncharacterized protein LOC109465951 [Branchiostoma belcheri]|uniref:Uncharacterized protein LOC109465951 n=1 Tax=Branchiostoma belcheri TaxID=7741 RepID=A0A6P4Y3J0_BRABE|nr:PREDICTED: uncharacterized protein LOC109465951 [Branchiostoma belcheri]
MPGLLSVTVHVCVLMLGTRVTAAPTRSPRAVTYTCPPGRVWDPFNQDCPPCTLCYEYPNMEMCKNNACPGPTTLTVGKTLPLQATTGVHGKEKLEKGLGGGIVAIIVLGSILASVALLLAILYKIRANGRERADDENNTEEELKLSVQEEQQGSSERVVAE